MINTFQNVEASRSAQTPWTRLLACSALYVLFGLLTFAESANAGGIDGAKIKRGDVSFSQDGNTLRVRASNGAIIEYNRFSVEAGQVMQFIQPSATSRVLNRVTGSELSRIDGSLLSNGIVYLVNPQGIRIGNGALINVGGFYAAAGAMSDKDFVRGNNNFTNLSGKVTNEGMIHARSVALVGQYVANRGTIQVDDGVIAMAAGDTVFLQHGTGPIMVTVNRSQLGADGSGAGTEAGVSNTGTINAGKGKVAMSSGDFYALAMDLSGTIIGKSIAARGGKDGVVAVNGTVDASSTTGKGGTIDVFGDRVGLFGDALVNANGATGGGSVRIGGDYLGTNAANAPQANRTVIGTDARITANATQSGDGGRVIVWSNEYTGFFGSIDASAAGSGKGGFVETSSHDNLQAFGSVNAKSARGKAGTWLLDPSDVTITNSADAGGSFNSSSPNVFTPTAATATADVATINSSLNLGTSVTINTGSVGDGLGGAGNITLAAAIEIISGGVNATLTLNAVGSITLSADITSTSSALSVALNAGTTVAMNSTVTTNGGDVNVNAGGGVFVANNVITSGTGEINITGNTLGLSQTGVTVNGGVTIQTTDGDLNITGMGGSNVGGYNYGVYNNAGTIQSGGAGNVSVTGTGGDSVGIRNYGVLNDNNALITSGGGTVLVTGLGGNGASEFNHGVRNDNGSIITSGGAGSVTVTGTGGSNAASGLNDGVINLGTITSGGAGSVTVTGTGGSGVGGANVGVYNGIICTITSGAGGNVTVTGTGGSGSGGQNYGVLNYGTITSSGEVIVTGSGGTGDDGDNYGVFNNSGTITSGAGGNVEVTGTGGIGGDFNFGVYNFATITSGGEVIVTGTGGTGDNNNYGVFNKSGTITSGGAVIVTGTGGTGGFGNDAIVIESGSIIAPGALTLTSNGGAINQVGGTITVDGTTTITAGANNVTLAQATNDFGGAVSVVSANNVSLTDANALTLGASTVANNFTATASGGIVVAGDITAGGTGTINITSNTLGLSQTGVTVNGGVTIQTTDGDLNITGTGGSDVGGYNYGVYNNAGTIQSGGAGNVSVTGTGGDSDGDRNYGVLNDNNALITSGGGTVLVTGRGGNGASEFNQGVRNDNGSIITSGGAGSVTVTGTGGSNAASGVNDGVVNFGTITSGGAGSVTVTGTGGSGVGGANVGVYNGFIGTITSGAGGNVTVTGRGGSSDGGQNYGVLNYGTITSSGEVIVTGTAGGTGGNNNYGVVLNQVGSSVGGVISSSGGHVFVTGTGGTGGFGNDAIVIESGFITAPGDLTLTSLGGDIHQVGGTITVAGTTTITAGTNDVTLAQATNDFGGAVTVVSARNVSLADTNALILGASTVANNFAATAGGGIVVAGNVTAGGTGAINITGNTNVTPGLRSIVGVTVNNGVIIQSTNGNLNITGMGGSNVGGYNYGVYNNGGTIQSGGAGNVSVTGTGGNSDGDRNYGVLNDNNALITSGGGTVLVTGRGGNGASDYNQGVRNDNGSIVTSGGAGIVTVRGTGGSNAASGVNDGVVNFGTITSGGAGSVTVTGTGGSGVGGVNVGVYNFGTITSGAGGNVTVTGTGGSGDGGQNYGVLNYNTITSGAGGNVEVTGSGGTGDDGYNYGVFNNSGTITSGAGGNVEVTGTGGIGGDFNYGVYNFATITSGGTGRVIVTGAGGNGSIYNIGVINVGTIESGGSGLVTVTGTGGSGDGGGNYGVFNSGTSGLLTSGGGDVFVTGTGGTGGSDNDAILMGLDSVVDAPGDLTLISNRGAINQTSGTITVVGTTTITANAASTDISLAGGPNDFAGPVNMGGNIDNVRDFKLRDINSSAGAANPDVSTFVNLRDLTIAYDDSSYVLPSLTMPSLRNVSISAIDVSMILNRSLTTHNGGTVTFNATNQLNIADGANIFAEGAVNLTGTNGIFINGDITTTGKAVSFHSATQLTDLTLFTIDTTNGNLNPNGADIFFGDAITVPTDNTEAIVLNAGTVGEITLTGHVGEPTRMLSNLTLTAANTIIKGDIYVAGNTTAGDITIINDTIIESKGSLTVGSIDGDGYAVTIATVDLILTAPITDVTTLTIQNSDPTGAITLMGLGGLSIDQTDWNLIGAGVNVVLGGSNYTGTVTVDGAWTNDRAVTVAFQPGSAGHFTVDAPITGSGSLTINGSGNTTTLAADIMQAAIHIADAVEVDAQLITLTATAGDITIDGTITSSNRNNLTVNASENVQLLGNIGTSVANTQLGTLTVDSGTNLGNTITFGALASSVYADNVKLNTGASSALATAATMGTIVSGGNIEYFTDTFAMGQNQKLTSLGGIRISGLAGSTSNATSVALGDVNAVGNLRVNANSITLLGRAGGPIVTNTGGTVNDARLDYVVGGRAYFSVAPIMGGTNPGNRAMFSNPTGNVDALGTLSLYATTTYPSAITSGLLTGVGGQVLDLSASSGSILFYGNPATIIPQMMSSLPPIGLLGDGDTLGDDEEKDAQQSGDKSDDSQTPATTQAEKAERDVPVNVNAVAVPVALR